MNREHPESGIKKVVALSYDSKADDAPTVAASGKGAVADRILDVARDAGIPVQQDPDLVEVLARVPVGDEIPVALYQAVAEILAFVYALNRESSHGGQT